MKKVAVIGSPDLHKNYQIALEKVGCGAVIFPDASYVKKYPKAFDGLLLPGGGDVLSTFSAYLPFLNIPSSARSCSSVSSMSESGMFLILPSGHFRYNPEKKPDEQEDTA